VTHCTEQIRRAFPFLVGDSALQVFSFFCFGLLTVAGVYLTDLTFIEDGIPSLIKKTNLINFAKRAKTAEVIRDIQQYQNVPYPLQPVPDLQDYILTNMQSAGDVHEMYDMSLSVEPREREDEKIARYTTYFHL
jgi:son of sevenless-like protein